tara:strand:- start:35345 stop:35548 length:204 start_codon:yes stop_codon:yes gene_type:complete
MLIDPIYALILMVLGLILVFAYFLKKKLDVTKNKKRAVITYFISFILTTFTGYLLIGSYYLLHIKIY